MANITVPIQVNMPDDWIEQIVNRLRNDPESEWAEIIRCKDCKHRPIKHGEFVDAPKGHDGFDDEICPCLCEDCYYNWMPEDDFFCKRGERREDE